MYILKVGGSVCTFKETNEFRVKKDTIRSIANEIKRAREEKLFRLIVVHGAGAFGHKMVTDYGINEGLKGRKHIEGFVRTHNSMEDLNKAFVDVFREEGLLGFPIQPSACIVQKNKKIEKFDPKIIEGLLKLSNDIIPIMYGDMVLDGKLKASVVSGDAIITFLAKKFKAEKVFLGTDVKGIFTADPKKSLGAELIQKIDKKNLEEVLREVGEAPTIDVTGGMRGKLLELRKSLKGIKIVVFDLTQHNNLLSLLREERIVCTEIKF